MHIGYARVSTSEQKLDLQLDALRAAGCERLFTDTVSGAKAARPGLEQALAACQTGDVLVVWKLDRLGRSLPHLVQTVRALGDRGAGFQSLRESIDTISSGGRLVFHLFAALAEFERDLIRERTHAGLAAARARGRKGGRPKGVNRAKQDPTYSIREICQIVGISRNTYHKYSARAAEQPSPPPASRRKTPAAHQPT
jgi:DNA invertase Pin-like site-specific DNA recombinase